MKAEHVNAFIGATTSVLEQVAQIKLNFKSPKVEKNDKKFENLILMVGITGELKGQFIIEIDNDFSREIASKMMMGMPVEEHNTMSKSALSELCNMIAGNSATMLANQNVTTDITTPTVILGGFDMRVEEMFLKLEDQSGDITLHISVN